MIDYPRKLQIPSWEGWSHHRSGWKFVLHHMRNLHSPKGTWFHGYLDGFFNLERQKIKQPWTGFLHNTPYHPKNNAQRYYDNVGLGDLLQTKNWEESYPYCQGIFTVSQYLAKFLRSKIDVPVVDLIHPIGVPEAKFSYQRFLQNQNKKLVLTGHWQRKFESIYFLNVDRNLMEPCVLECYGFYECINTIRKLTGPRFNTLQRIRYLNDQQYDELHTRNIIFLDLYDAGACNTLLDCVVRHTPLLVRKMPGIVEYLGDDYPFYFNTLQEAEIKVHNLSLIKETYEYLKQMDKTTLTPKYFLDSLVASELYRNFPNEHRFKMFV